MGFIQKKDEEDKEYIDGVEIITRGEGPDDDPETEVIDIAEGLTAEDISGTTARREAENALETEADPELLGEPEEVVIVFDDDFDVEYEDVEDEEAAEPLDEDEPGEDEPSEDEADTEADAGAEEASSEAEEDESAEDDAEDEDEDAETGEDEFYEEDEQEPQGLLASKNGKIYLAASVIAVVVAVIVGYMVGSGALGGSGSTSSSSSSSSSSEESTTGLSSAYITEDELGNIVATWTYDGATYDVTAQEALESQYSLETLVLDDGTYEAPTTDTILSYVENQILSLAAADAGISLSEDEIAEYAENTLGSSDYEEIADTYGVTEEQAESIVTQMAEINALYDTVVPEVDATYPEEPEEPEDGDEDTASAEYAAYIIELAGDEWDSETGTWASTDGDYYAALGEEDFTEDSATYSQALTAFYVAYTVYYEAYTEASSAWTEYANELYGLAEITMYGLYS